MRIVIFNSPERVTQYPFEGQRAFRNTRKIGSDIIGEYYGNASEVELPTYVGEWPPAPPATYRTRVRPGELIELIGNVGYSKIYRAAYPQGNKPEDDTALVFFEKARNPTSPDRLIDVNDPRVVAALDYFIVQTYITEADKTRVLQGVQE